MTVELPPKHGFFIVLHDDGRTELWAAKNLIAVQQRILAALGVSVVGVSRLQAEARAYRLGLPISVLPENYPEPAAPATVREP